MNQEAKHEFKELAQDFTHNYIKHSGLFHNLSGAEWDKLAEMIAAKLISLTDQMVDMTAQNVEGNDGNPDMGTLRLALSRVTFLPLE